MAVALGLAAALAYGVSDFLAGWLSRRVSFVLVGLILEMTAAFLSLSTLLWAGGAGPSSEAVLWGVVSGLGGGVGSLALYRGLSRGSMNVVAPLSAVGSVALPVLVGVLFGDRPSWLAGVGVVLAVPAVWCVSSSSGTSGTRSRADVVDGLTAGLGFGILFVGLAKAGDGAGLWPVATGQTTTLLVVVAYALAVRGRRATDEAPWRATRPDIATGIFAGVLTVTAALLFFHASQLGLLSIVGVLASLYPAVTVVLAWAVFREQANRVQIIGMALCALSVTAIVVT